jgi:hypothetical protein
MTDGDGLTGGVEFKDRKTGLMVFGIFEILFGAFCALMVPLMAVGMLVASKAPGQQVQPKMMVASLLFYVVIAVWFVWVGIGSILARRWARALILVTSWFWLVAGLMGLGFMVWFGPQMFAQMGKAGQMPEAIVTAVKYITIGFSIVFYVMIPGVLVLFYGNRNVKATCERYDTKIRWTDGCPLPVLGVSIMCAFGAASMLIMGFYGWVMPLFGTILSGAAGAAAAIAFMAVLAYVARGTYRLDITAWRVAVLLVIFWSVSTVVTFSRVSIIEFYEKMNFPPQQIEMMKPFVGSMQTGMVPLMGIWAAVIIAYLVYVMKYFLPAKTPETKP